VHTSWDDPGSRAIVARGRLESGGDACHGDWFGRTTRRQLDHATVRVPALAAAHGAQLRERSCAGAVCADAGVEVAIGLEEGELGSHAQGIGRRNPRLELGEGSHVDAAIV
jgi:hypothetical protein